MHSIFSYRESLLHHSIWDQVSGSWQRVLSCVVCAGNVANVLKQHCKTALRTDTLKAGSSTKSKEVRKRYLHVNVENNTSYTNSLLQTFPTSLSKARPRYYN